MNNATFGEIKFDTGWNKKSTIELFGYSYAIIIKAKAYFEEEGITSEQEASFVDFIYKKDNIQKTIEESLQDFSNINASERFTPRTLLFQRDGSYALLLDDAEDTDNGIVVCIAPNVKLLTQDEYL